MRRSVQRGAEVDELAELRVQVGLGRELGLAVVVEDALLAVGVGRFEGTVGLAERGRLAYRLGFKVAVVADVVADCRGNGGVALGEDGAFLVGRRCGEGG